MNPDPRIQTWSRSPKRCTFGAALWRNSSKAVAARAAALAKASRPDIALWFCRVLSMENKI